MRKCTFLITGCAGFIAARVATMLLERGHQIAGIDNMNQTYDQRMKDWRLAQLERYPGMTFYKADINDKQSVLQIVDEMIVRDGLPPSAVIHLAARAGVRDSVEDPIGHFETNVLGTINMLDACVHHHINKLVLASTSSVYGIQTRMPWREQDEISAPLSPYGASKKAAEVICRTYHELHGLDISIPRFFTVYGPAGRPDMSIFRFIQWINEGHPITIYGDGTQRRDFAYIDDIARGIISALTPVRYAIFNLGSDRPIPLIDVVQMISAKLHKPAHLQFAPKHFADPMASWADVGEAGRLLNWTPQVSFEDGLDAAIEWYLTNREWAQHIVTL